MAKYLNSQTSFIVNGLTYEPWVIAKLRQFETPPLHLASKLGFQPLTKAVLVAIWTQNGHL
jgi:hypothetical protein